VIRIALAGLGLIGRERLDALQALSSRGRSVTLIAVLDPELEDRSAVAPAFEPVWCSELSDVIALAPDWVFVATPHDVAVHYVRRLVQESSARVLVEKPLGRTGAEAEALIERSEEGQLWVGHNYRFFAGVEAALRDVETGVFGELISANLVIGHGNSPGMERSWKLDPSRAGGGALIDPGVHLLDLARLLGEEGLAVVGGRAWQGFWKTGIEEECHLLLESERVPVLNLQASLVRWRNTFRLELNGDERYGVVEGRGRSYGPQSYRRGQRWCWQSAPSQAESEELVLVTDGADVFEKELEALLFGGDTNPYGPCTAGQAAENMRLLDACRKVVGLPDPPQ
jgi:predicted dehydrogenase